MNQPCVVAVHILYSGNVLHRSFKASLQGSWKPKRFNINFSTVMADVTQKLTEKSRYFLRYVTYVFFKSYALLISMVTIMVFNSAWSNQSSVCSSILSWISVWQTELITASIAGQINWDKTECSNLWKPKTVNIKMYWKFTRSDVLLEVKLLQLFLSSFLLGIVVFLSVLEAGVKWLACFKILKYWILEDWEWNM